MTRTPAELRVERDRLLESGRTEAEVEAMQLAASLTPHHLRVVLAFTERAAQSKYARNDVAFDQFLRDLWRESKIAAVSRRESETGVSAPHPPGGAT